MHLNDEQKREVARWIAEGAKLSEVQQRLGEEYGIRLTYMEARFLVDDLALVPQELHPPKEAAPKEEEAGGAADGSLDGGAGAAGLDGAEAPVAAGGGVSVSLDQIVRPGALVSGKVVFSDGVTADWYLDQMGRFGLVPPEPNYRPKPEDLADFKVKLEKELARQGI